MNMRKYHHLFTLRRSEALFVSNNRRVHRNFQVEYQSHRRHPQSPPSSPPPSSYWHIFHNNYNKNAIVSHNFFQTTHLSHMRYHYHSQRCAIHTSEVPLYEDESPHDYQVVVKANEVISAAVSPKNHHWLSLSNLDLLLPPIEAGVYFCYKKKDNIDMSPETVVKTIKKSLAAVLSTFYPLAGEIVPNSLGEPEVLCNNNGVEFVHAHADVELKDLNFYNPDLSVKGKLMPKINHGLLAVKATELKCGSIIVSCAFNHQITDGYSLNMFLVAWANYTKMERIPNIPSFRPSVLNSRRPPRYQASLDNLYVPISSLPPPSSFEEPLDSRMYYVRRESIEQLQSLASTNEVKRSKLISFTSFVWKLLALGSNDAENTSSRMGVVVDGRRFLTPNSDKISNSLETHFGNVLSVPYGVAAHSDLREMELHQVANQVHRVVAEATNEEHFRGLIDWVELHRPQPAVAMIYFGLKTSEGDAVVVSSGQGLPIKEMDFGWGKPEFGSYYVPWGSRTGYITTMPSAHSNGDWVVYMHLKQKELDVVERMASNVFTPLSIVKFI